MSKLRSPWIGPIVGHVTDTTARIWIRAKAPDDEGVIPSSNNRTVGVVSILNAAGVADPSQTYYFRLHREFDRTGTFILGQDISFGLPEMTEKQKHMGHVDRVAPLKPDTHYSIRAGVLVIDDAFEDEENVDSDDLLGRLPPASVWTDALMNLPAHESSAQFRTFPDRTLGQLSFLVGSCRYPGLMFKIKKSDVIFKPMQQRIDNQSQTAQPIRFVMMMGDQIYADLLNRYIPVKRADTYEEFQERYIEAFGSPNLRKLFQSVPNYMILDDHEIEDNWTQDRIGQSDKRILFHLAVGAYMSYQWSHGPRSFDRHLYYEFGCGGYPFFVLDTRTQRFRDDIKDELKDNHLLGRPSPDPVNYPSQLDHLCHWLTAQQSIIGNRPKFIVTPSVFVPNDVTTVRSDGHKNASDSWEAFPVTRERLLEVIVTHQIQNVVFLSGDIHCSCVAELSFRGSSAAEKLKAFSITSSAFYWPFPFADGEPSSYVHDSAKQQDTFHFSGGRYAMDYKAYNFCQDDNFCQIDLNWDRRELTVQVFGKNGDLLVNRDAPTRPEMRALLSLAQ